MWLHTVVTMPLTCSSSRSRHTGHVGSSVWPGGGGGGGGGGAVPLPPWSEAEP